MPAAAFTTIATLFQVGFGKYIQAVFNVKINSLLKFGFLHLA